MFRNAWIGLAAVISLAGCSSVAASTGEGKAAAHTPPTEHGQIVGWTGGDATVYATVGFFSPAPQIFAVGAVAPDGGFAIAYPAVLPPDLLAKPTDQCSTIVSSDPNVTTAFTGNDLIFQHGKPAGATHSGSSIGVASFSAIANGDTRSGFLYADRDTVQTGYCERSIVMGKFSLDFRQNFDLPLRKGWNEVVAVFSTPQPGQVVSDLKIGSNPDERYFLFNAMPQR